MRILILSAKDDNGGIGIAIKKAFDKHAPEHEVRSVTRHGNFIGFDHDILWKQGDEGCREYVQSLFDAADVIHIMDVFEAADQFRGYDAKAKVFHHHGYDFRANKDELMARCRAERIPQYIATHDLLRYADDLEWLPNPTDIDTLQWYRSTATPSEMRPVVVQSPTSLSANGTESFLAGVRQCEERGLDFELDLIQNVPWEECMSRKARGSVIFDSFGVGYGISTLEAWGMGIPVIHGGDEQTEDAVMRTIGYQPYLHATRDNIGEQLADMISDHHLRRYWAEQGTQAVNDFHSEQAVVKNLTRIYEEAIG